MKRKRDRGELTNKTFRLRSDLLRRLETRATSEDVSVNQLVDRILEGSVPARNPIEAIISIADQDRRERGTSPKARHFTKDELHEEDE